MTDMHYNMRAKMKEFSALARSHIPGFFALSAHPFVAVSVMQLCSPMGPLGLYKPEEVHWCVFLCRLLCIYVCASVCVCVCVCVCVRAAHLPLGQTTSVLQKSHDHVNLQRAAPSLGAVAP